ncbi:ROK family transcriptional regulator [Roseateles paludis]|uniref:ROK family transcriptional regulator n=1 Tax=Roseateles paludis TaxID=3145238 RepID=A0ABV0FWH5_9BURK
MTGDQRLVKHINRVALLRLLREVPGLSRAELADRSGLTRSTISLLTKELIDEGWLVEDDAVVTGQLGRRPVPLRLDGCGLALIGAELTPDALRVVTTSIHGEVLESRSAELRDQAPEAACRQLVAMVTVLAQHVIQAGQQVLGIGVALPGAVDAARGVLQLAPNIGWRDVPVGERLRAELAGAGLDALPVFCQNEADLAAIGETEFGPRPADSPLIYISCGVGLGSGIVLGHTLFTGATGAAGEIGHTTLHVGGRVCSCGRRGCAEAYVGLRAIAEAAGLRPKGGSLDHAGLRARMSAGDPQASAAFREAGEHLGVLLQNVWTTFDPRAIVLGGEVVSLGGSAFVEPALATLARFAQAAGVAAPQVRVGRFNELAAAVGGAAYALHALMNPYQARG